MHTDRVGSARCADPRRVQRRNASADGVNVAEKGSGPARAGGQRSALTLPTNLLGAVLGGIRQPPWRMCGRLHDGFSIPHPR